MRFRLLVPLLLVAALSACSDATTTSPSPSGTTTTGAPTPTSPQGTSALPRPDAPSPSPSPSAPPTVAEHDSAGALAADLVAAEQAIRDLRTPPEQLRGWAHLQHASYRELHDHPDWVEPLRGAFPEDLRHVFDANLDAQEHLFALTSPRGSLPDWRIVAAPPADELLGSYRSAGEEFGVDWSYLAAIHLVESRMGRIRGDSEAGAQGPMQFLPSTWEAYGEGDIQNPHDAIRAAARYLVAHGAPDDMDSALWAYNHSDHYVTAIQRYAEVMRDDVRAYHAYYHWRVYYRLRSGDVVLEEGWSRDDG